MAVNLDNIVGLTTQINALRAQAERLPDGPAKQLLEAQLAGLEAQLTAEAQHQQSQVEASQNVMNQLQLFNTLQNLVGTTAPAIINLFK
jgi:hypothetical protein